MQNAIVHGKILKNLLDKKNLKIIVCLYRQGPSKNDLEKNYLRSTKINISSTLLDGVYVGKTKIKKQL